MNDGSGFRVEPDGVGVRYPGYQTAIYDRHGAVPTSLARNAVGW